MLSLVNLVQAAEPSARFFRPQMGVMQPYSEEAAFYVRRRAAIYHREFRDIVRHQASGLRLGVYGYLGSGGFAPELGRDLRTFVSEGLLFPGLSFLAVFEGGRLHGDDEFESAVVQEFRALTLRESRAGISPGCFTGGGEHRRFHFQVGGQACFAQGFYPDCRYRERAFSAPALLFELEERSEARFRRRREPVRASA